MYDITFEIPTSIPEVLERAVDKILPEIELIRIPAEEEGNVAWVAKTEEYSDFFELGSYVEQFMSQQRAVDEIENNISDN